MNKIMLAVSCVALLAVVAASRAQEMPKMPEPQKEHQWLRQFVGDWENEGEATMPTEPVQPAMKFKGTETARQLGGFWLIADGKGEMMGTPMQTILTLGYDADKKKYVGTWVDSMSGHLWKYEGTLDPTGKTLTLNTEGPCPLYPGKTFKFKEVVEFKTPDHKVFTSSMQKEDGTWQQMVTINSRRKR